MGLARSWDVPDEFWMHWWRSRQLRTFVQQVDVEPAGKGPAGRRSAPEFQRQVMDQMERYHRYPMTGPVALDLHFHAARRNPPGIHRAAKHTLDILGAALPGCERSRRRHVLYHDDRQVKLLYVDLDQSWQRDASENGRPGSVFIAARRASDVIADLCMAGRLSREHYDEDDDSPFQSPDLPDDPDRPRWHQILGERVREQMIFDADNDTYQTAKKASDGLEHGFMGLDEVAAHAVKCADKTFHHVRRTIVELLDLPAAAADELMAIKPKDVQSRRKIARGRLIGAAEDPAAEGQLYPLLEWSSSIGSVVREGSTFQISANDKITVRTHPDVSFQLDRLEIYGRLEDGQAPVQMSEQDTLIEPTPEPKSTRMLAAVMPMVDAATASGADIGQIFPRTLAFYLFGQGVAFFQSAHTLINSQQPVETLSALRGLAIIASRFEQITEDSGPGIGAVVRMALDSPGELGADPALAAMYREELLKGATSAGITIPDELPEPETSAIYGSLAFEMRLAQSTVNGTYAAVGLHVKQSDAEHADFRTRLEPGPFTEMVASASVIAQLDLLKRGAKLLGWAVDEQKIDDLLEAARGLNQASANQLMRASSTDPAE